MLYGFFYIYNCQRRDYNIEIAKIQPITYTSYKLNIYFIK